MDAFAVAVCRGLEMRRIDYRQALLIAVFFGGFQALMPVVGYLLGAGFEHYISSFDHWIAFLAAGLHRRQDDLGSRAGRGRGTRGRRWSLKLLVMMAVATSIDALAVGITFAFLQMDILSSAAAIGADDVSSSPLAACAAGNRFGARYKKEGGDRRRRGAGAHRREDTSGASGRDRLLGRKEKKGDRLCVGSLSIIVMLALTAGLPASAGRSGCTGACPSRWPRRACARARRSCRRRCSRHGRPREPS